MKNEVDMDSKNSVKWDEYVSSWNTINHPNYYNRGNIEAIDYIEDQKLGFHLGNAIKYITRARHKSRYKEDLKKAIWYLNRAIWYSKRAVKNEEWEERMIDSIIARLFEIKKDLGEHGFTTFTVDDQISFMKGLK